MIHRILSKKLKAAAREFPAVALIGPRQSGKTTLVKSVFPALQYVSLEELDNREFAKADPRGFLATYSQGVIIDEAQRAPELFSYIQGVVDSHKRPGQFILTGSQNFLLQETISQSLAGRVAIFTLLPFSLGELGGKRSPAKDFTEYLFKGFYPALYDKKVNIGDWYSNYIKTYVERDVRQIKHITDLHAFQKFVRLCAGRVGQLLNLSSLANDAGITHNTAKAWLSVLEASFIVFLLQPHHKNFNKRLVKMPKLYFYDPGLVSSLWGVTDKNQLLSHPFKGNLFETFIIAECIKYQMHRGLSPNCYFWRDKVGHEIDCLIDAAGVLTPIEIKSGHTVTDDYFANLKYWRALSGAHAERSFVVYGGERNERRSAGNVVGWQHTDDLFERQSK